jgi:2-polyprenyl-6-methoxyphenol hydroxylase-like FAD-dependent oxidoreductase
VLGTHPWIVGSWVAERFREGRIFLAGDSAHVTPPAGGFGASLGVHDAHNLCTKLGQVLSGEASEKLLDCYEPERFPVANFLQAHGISETGAILIRPDGFVAWRAPSQEASPIEELADALGHLLARSIQSPFA